MKKFLRSCAALALVGALLFGGMAAGLFDAAAAGKPNLKKLEKDLLSVMEEHDVTAMNIAVVKGDQVIYSNALGLKDRATEEPADIANIFRIASISKSFSGVSIMQLVEAGKLSLEDDVNDLLGWSVRNPRFPDDPITVRMLLSHTSSVIDSPAVNYKRSLDGTLIPGTADPDTILCCYSKFRPGKHYQYSNRGINLVGAIIEKVSGERFDVYVRNHILRPLGLTDAGFNVDSLDRNRFNTLYNVRDGKFIAQSMAYKHLPAYDNYRIGIDTPAYSPAGGMKITVLGLAEWMMTLKRGGVGTNGVRILSEASVERMFKRESPGAKDDFGNGYGLTLTTSKTLLGFPMRGHGGSAYGLKSCMYYSVDQDFGIVIFCSSTDGKKCESGRGTGPAAYCEAAELLYDTLIK